MMMMMMIMMMMMMMVVVMMTMMMTMQPLSAPSAPHLFGRARLSMSPAVAGQPASTSAPPRGLATSERPCPRTRRPGRRVVPKLCG